LCISGDTVENDWYLERITEARQHAEEYTGRALATQTIEAYLDQFPCKDHFELPRPPLQSVTSLKYKDSAGTETTMTATTAYLVDLKRDVGRIVLPYGVSWPSFTKYPVNPIVAEYVAGYTAQNPIPKKIKAAMLIYVGYMDRNRDAVAPDDKTLERINQMLNAYRVHWF
jgi:uncharacterized phiE125 gp8 family phage protein